MALDAKEKQDAPKMEIRIIQIKDKSWCTGPIAYVPPHPTN